MDNVSEEKFLQILRHSFLQSCYALELEMYREDLKTKFEEIRRRYVDAGVLGFSSNLYKKDPVFSGEDGVFTDRFCGFCSLHNLNYDSYKELARRIFHDTSKIL